MWLVDDGIGSRGHQMNILDEDMTHAGVGIFRSEAGWFIVFNAVKNWQCRSTCNLISLSNIKESNITGNGYYNRTTDLKKRNDIDDDDEEQTKKENFNSHEPSPDYFNNRRVSLKNEAEEKKHRELNRKKYLTVPKLITENGNDSGNVGNSHLESEVFKKGDKNVNEVSREDMKGEKKLARLTSKIDMLRQQIQKNYNDMNNLKDKENYNESLQNSMLRKTQKLEKEDRSIDSHASCLKLMFHIAITTLLLIQ